MAHEFISPEGSNLTSLFESIQNLRESKPLKYRIYLVEGKPMRREKVFGPVQRAANESPQDTLLIRLYEYVTRLKVGFNAHFMKLLAQEINRKGMVYKEIYEITKTYLNPFEIEEETKKIGLSWYIQIGKEQKLTKKTLYEEDIEQDYWQCLNQLERKGWKLILLVSSIQGFSETAQQFIIKFLESYKSSILLFGGLERLSLSKFLEETGISDFYSFCYLDFEEYKEKGDEEAMIIAEAIVNAFSKAPQYFRYFKFEQQAQIEGKLLPGLAAHKFDLAILGHLQMRHDYPPRPICTNYDCVILISLLKESVEYEEILLDLCHAAYEIREGIEIERGRWFEPWDTYLFLSVPSVSDSVLKSYRHQPYRNVFLLLRDGTFRNLSPHKWMDGAVLKEISKWIHRK